MNIFISISGGIVLGILFFGGLWFTVRALLFTRHPVLLTVSSFWIRTLIALAGFLLFMDGKWQNALACLAGFALGRVICSVFLHRPERGPRCT